MSRRARRGRAFWLEHAHAAGQAEQTVDAYAREHGLSVKALYRWRGELRREQESKTSAGVEASRGDFVRVEIPDSQPLPPSTLRITFPNGCSAELVGALDVQTLGVVLLNVGSV